MTRINKSQRDQLIAVAFGAAAVIACLWYAVVLAQNKQLKVAEANCVKMRNTLKVGSDKVARPTWWGRTGQEPGGSQATGERPGPGTRADLVDGGNHARLLVAGQ